MRPSFPLFQCLRPEYVLSKFHTANNVYPSNIPGKTFLPGWWSLDIIAPNGMTGRSNGPPNHRA